MPQRDAIAAGLSHLGIINLVADTNVERVDVGAHPTTSTFIEPTATGHDDAQRVLSA